MSADGFTLVIVGKKITVVLSGRTGHADYINGHYDLQEGAQHEGHPTFKHVYGTSPGFGPERGKNLFLFFDVGERAWTIAHDLSGRQPLARCHGEAPRPDKSDSPWRVLNKDGSLSQDPSVRCGGLGGGGGMGD